jgi:hypothetical protein
MDRDVIVGLTEALETGVTRRTGDHGYRPCATMLRQSGGRGIASGGPSDSGRELRTRRPPIPQAGPAIHPATRSWRS